MITTLNSQIFPEFSCEVTIDPQTGTHIGQLKYYRADSGEISGPDLQSVQAQFDIIADYAANWAIVRESIIITNYFNQMEAGDVLDMDGMILGSWKYVFDEWCNFIEDGATEATLSAPSLWMLHDAIVEWAASKRATE